jgi:hypothetical protein
MIWFCVMEGLLSLFVQRDVQQYMHHVVHQSRCILDAKQAGELQLQPSRPAQISV